MIRNRFLGQNASAKQMQKQQPDGKIRLLFLSIHDKIKQEVYLIFESMIGMREGMSLLLTVSA